MIVAALVIIAIALILYYGFRPLRERSNYPAGITPLPFVGNLLSLRGSKFSTFEDVVRMQRKTGHPDAVTMWLGMTPAVFLNTYNGIKSALIDNQLDFASRMDFDMFFDVFFPGTEDIVFGKYSPKWTANKKIGSRLLRKVIESGKLEGNVVDAADRVIEDLTKLDLSQPIDISHYTSNIVYNVLTSLCFSTAFSSDDPKYLELLEVREQNINPPPLLLLLPFVPLRKIWKPVLQKSKMFQDSVVATAKRQVNFFQQFFDEHTANFAEKKAAGEQFDDIVYAIIDEQKNPQGDSEPIDSATAIMIIFDIFGAGTETTSITLQWFTLEMAANPNLQEELFAHVTNVVGSKGVPTLEDRSQLPLVEATIMEVLRLHSAAPLAIPHAKSKRDALLFGRHPVADDALIICNIYAAQRDPEAFEDPEKFSPHRFLENNICVKPSTLIPFGVGRRVCMGEQLAKNDLFLVVTTLVQRLKFCPAPGTPLEMRHDVGNGTTNVPKYQKLMVELR